MDEVHRKGAFTCLFLREDFIVAPIEAKDPACSSSCIKMTVSDTTLHCRWAGARPLRDPFLEGRRFQLKTSPDFWGPDLTHLTELACGCAG